MSGVNPIILIQMLMMYHRDVLNKNNTSRIPRTFAFTRNNRLLVHKETEDEIKKRRSILTPDTSLSAEKEIHRLLKKTLKDQLHYVWIDPDMANIAVPLQISAGNTGYGILPTGSKIDIPEGKFIRAFTYWEKVNDIDLSCFAITKDGRQEEFSWRNMYAKQDNEIVFSGDQTSGYSGGSEYFDINIDLFRKSHPGYQYLVFCNNVYSDIYFSKCDCKAGFMIREENPLYIPYWKGERTHDHAVSGTIFDPRTVETSFQINADSTFAYLFAIDLEHRQMIWLNMERADNQRVAGTTSMDFLLRYFTMTDVFNVYKLYEYAATRVVNDKRDADIIVSDKEHETADVEVVHSWDIEKMHSLLTP